MKVVKYKMNSGTSVTGKEISTEKTSEDWKLFQKLTNINHNHVFPNTHQ